MISILTPVAAGNSITLWLQPLAGASRWRILRKRADTISAQNDAGSNVVFDGDDKFITDNQSLENGTLYFYRVFYLVGSSWVSTPSRSCTPNAIFHNISRDVIDVVRERLDLGLKVLVDRGDLIHPDGRIPVLLATPAYEDAPFPCVTVHLVSCSEANRFVGEMPVPDSHYDDGDVSEVEGWLSNFQLTIIAWCLNGDVRAELRKALMSIIQANLSVFESEQMSLISPQFSDVDDMQTYQAPMYQVSCTFTCIAPTAVESRSPVVRATKATLIY